jgi:intergrase/recombinase
MSPDKRIDIMKALSSLSRFQGCYDRWLQIKQKYNLKWSTGNESLDSLERVFDESKTLDTMIGWVRRTHQELPSKYRDIFLFNTLTGLRPTECLESIRLIKNPEYLKTYHNTDRQVLEHFRFPEIFIRRSKSAYISLVNQEILDIARNGITENSKAMYSYNAIRYRLKYSGVGMHMKWCRKVFASWLHHKGIQSDIIDLLQGRVGKSIFVRSYLTPSLSYRDKIMDVLNELKKRGRELKNK